MLVQVQCVQYIIVEFLGKRKMKGPPWRREKHSKRGDDDVHDDNNDDDDWTPTAKTNGNGNYFYVMQY